MKIHKALSTKMNFMAGWSEMMDLARDQCKNSELGRSDIEGFNKRTDHMAVLNLRSATDS